MSLLEAAAYLGQTNLRVPGGSSQKSEVDLTFTVTSGMLTLNMSVTANLEKGCHRIREQMKIPINGTAELVRTTRTRKKPEVYCVTLLSGHMTRIRTS